MAIEVRQVGSREAMPILAYFSARSVDEIVAVQVQGSDH